MTTGWLADRVSQALGSPACSCDLRIPGERLGRALHSSTSASGQKRWLSATMSRRRVRRHQEAIIMGIPAFFPTLFSRLSLKRKQPGLKVDSPNYLSFSTSLEKCQDVDWQWCGKLFRYLSPIFYQSCSQRKSRQPLSLLTQEALDIAVSKFQTHIVIYVHRWH